jgi:hypothetical protein
MRPNVLTALWSLPPAHSHAHIPARTSEIHPRIVWLAGIMGRPAAEVESEIHSVIARQFDKGRFLSLDVAVKCHGEAQAFYDGMHGRDWPDEPTDA